MKRKPRKPVTPKNNGRSRPKVYHPVSSNSHSSRRVVYKPVSAPTTEQPSKLRPVSTSNPAKPSPTYRSVNRFITPTRKPIKKPLSAKPSTLQKGITQKKRPLTDSKLSMRFVFYMKPQLQEPQKRRKR